MKYARNFCQLILCLFVMVTACPKTGHAASNDHFVALQALNHSLMAIEMVLRQPDRATVDAQRLAIIDELKLPDSVLKTKDKKKDNANDLQQLYNDLTSLFRECGSDAAGLARAREAEEAAVIAALSKIPSQTRLVAGSARASFKPLAKGVMGNGPLGSLLVLAENPADHEPPLARIGDGQAEKLDQSAIERFASVRKQLLAVRDDLVSKTRLPARDVLTVERIGIFLEMLGKASQPAEAMSFARKHEKDLSFWPSFWFHYGKFAQAKGDDGLARRCFREFERRSRSCLKKNTYYAAMSLNRISMLDSGEAEEARRVLEILNKNLTPGDWPKGLVAALQYYTLGDGRRAEQHIRRNASELKVLEPVHTRLLGLLKEKSFAVRALLAEAGAKPENGKTSEPASTETKNPDDASGEAKYKPAEKTLKNQQGNQEDKAIDKSASDDPGKDDQAMDKNAIEKSGDQADKTEAGQTGPEQTGQTNPSEPSTDSNTMSAGKEKTGNGNEDQEPAAMPVDNDQDNGSVPGESAKGHDTDGQKEQQDKPGEQDGKGQRVQRDMLLEGNATDSSSSDPDRPMPATGTIGSKPDKSEDRQDSVSGEQGGASAKPDSAEEQGSQLLDPATSPGFAEKVMPDSGAEAGSGDQGKADPESSQDPDQDSAANAKDAKALYLLAMNHYRGENGKKDLVRAIQMLNQAAGQGNADAQTQLGICHYTGNGVARDKAKAVKYFSLAADQGNTNAMFNLAVCYQAGDGVEKDVAKAAGLYTAAALKGETRSQYNLAMLYYRGEGVEKDVSKARKLLESLSAQGFVPARKAMEYLETKQEKSGQAKQ